MQISCIFDRCVLRKKFRETKEIQEADQFSSTDAARKQKSASDFPREIAPSQFFWKTRMYTRIYIT